MNKMFFIYLTSNSIKMKLYQKFVVLILIVLFSVSCSNDDSSCRLVSIQTKTLTYDEIGTVITFNPDFLGKTNLIYNNNKIVKTKGGPYTYNDGNAAPIRFSNDIENNIWYEGNRVITEDNFDLDNPKRVEFTIEAGQLIRKKENYLNSIPPFVVEYDYIYSANSVEEKRNNLPYRMFYFEDGNLVRVEQLFYNSNHEIVSRNDLIFSEFDTNENLAKGMYFIKGAFYKAFSNNNHKRVERKRYDYINGAFVQNTMYNSSSWMSSTDGIFEQECD